MVCVVVVVVVVVAIVRRRVFVRCLAMDEPGQESSFFPVVSETYCCTHTMKEGREHCRGCLVQTTKYYAYVFLHT